VPLVTSRALILQAFPYSDTSKILRLYTADYGLRSAIARGALRPRSRYGGVLEPFTEGEATLYLKPGRDLQTLGGFDLLKSRQALGRDLTGFAGASLIAELLLRFTTEEPNSALLDVACAVLDAIAAAAPHEVETAVIGGAWQIVTLHGFRPRTDACVTCGRVLESDEVARFDVEGGGVACAVCRPHGRPFDAASRLELERMVGGDVLETPLARPELHHALLRTFLGTHLSAEHPLRSLELFVRAHG
jgi:DNA repair protein RecO (recombination protein O)